LVLSRKCGTFSGEAKPISEEVFCTENLLIVKALFFLLAEGLGTLAQARKPSLGLTQDCGDGD
jgi:hypothetical protein